MANKTDAPQNGSMKLILGVVVALALAATAYFIYSKNNAAEKNASADAVEKLADNVMGDDKAPVTIIEFSSMTCPHCAIFHKDTLPGLKSKYIDTGKVKYILREFPLDPLAGAAFMLGRCLSKPESYFDFIDVLYARQNEWTSAKDRIGALRDLAKQAGFTDETFQQCLDNKKLYAQILDVKNNGMEEFKIRSTPTFFINGSRLEGAQPLAEFEKLIEPVLK